MKSGTKGQEATQVCVCGQMDGMALVLVLVPIQCNGASLVTIPTLVSSLTHHTQRMDGVVVGMRG